jgi:hypothetical protein
LRFNGLPGVHSQERMKDHILRSGCYSASENEAIYQEWFANGPRYLFRAVNAKYNIVEAPSVTLAVLSGQISLIASPGHTGSTLTITP